MENNDVCAAPRENFKKPPPRSLLIAPMELAQQALMNNAVHAFMQVEKNYAVPLGLRSYPENTIRKHFHFIEKKRWSYYLRHIANYNVPEGAADAVEGVTHSYDSVPQIGINRCYHTFATLVHESIHFFSHYTFRRACNVDVYEGATEFLTRSLLNEYGPRKDTHGQGDIYNHELALLQSVISNVDDRRQLCKAYFGGDAGSISQLRQRLRN